MKFSNVANVQQFLIEIGAINLISTAKQDFIPDENQLDTFYSLRSSLIEGMKSFRRSQSAKASWRKNRSGYMKGIKSFHKSTEGKKFHRSLGRHLATRMTGRGGMYTHGEKFEALKALSSLRTHLYIDTTYYKSVDEQVEFELFMDEVLQAITNEELYILHGDEDPRIQHTGEGDYVSDIDVLSRAIDVTGMVEDYCKFSNIPFSEDLITKFITNTQSEENTIVQSLELLVP